MLDRSQTLLIRGPSQRKSSGLGSVSADPAMSFCLSTSSGPSALCPVLWTSQRAAGLPAEVQNPWLSRYDNLHLSVVMSCTANRKGTPA